MSNVDLSRRESFAAIGRFFAGLVTLSLFPKSTPVVVAAPAMMPPSASLSSDWTTLSQSVYVENRPIQAIGMQEMVSYKFHRATRSTVKFLESEVAYNPTEEEAARAT